MTFEEWKHSTTPPAPTPINPAAMARNTTPVVAPKVPSSKNPVISMSNKPPVSTPKISTGYKASSTNPNQNYYDSSQYKSLGSPIPTSSPSAAQLARSNPPAAIPNSQFFTNDQLLAKRGTLLDDLRKEGFTDTEIAGLGGAQDVNGSIDRLVGIGQAQNLAGGRGQNITTLDPFSSASLQETLAKARGEKQVQRINDTLKTKEQQIKDDVAAVYRPEFTKAREAADKARETDLRLSGRSAFGSATGERQDDLNTKQQEIESSIAAQQRLEEQQQMAIARGASDDEIAGINAQIQAAADNRMKVQTDLELQTAGLDQATLDIANEREKQVIKDQLDAAKSGLKWDNESGSYIKDPNSPDNPQDFDFQMQTDNFGNVTQIRTNKQTGEVTQNNLGQIGKGDISGGSKFQLQFNPLTGDQVIFDPSTGQSFNMDSPDEVPFFGGTPSTDNQTGETTGDNGFVNSSPTSDSKGVKILGNGNGLGGNCVLYARTKNPSLPYGLFDKQDKKNAIAKAGSTDWAQLKVGDSILSGEGSVGHAMTCVGFNPKTGKAIIEEANYTPGKITKGREISVTDPVFYGFIPNKNSDPSVLNPNFQNEGKNEAITSQVTRSSGKATEAGILALAAENGYDINDKSKRALVLDNYKRYGILPTETQESKDKKFASEKDDWYKQMNLKLQMEGNDRQINQNNFQNADKLRADFDSQQAVKDFKDVQTTSNEFKNIINSGVQGPADLALVFKFMKALDPSSVVREAEFDSAAQSGGLFKGAFAKFNGKFDQGQILTPQLRKDFETLVNKSLEAKKLAYNQEVNRASQVASKLGVDPSLVIYNYDQSNGANTNSPFSAPAPTQSLPAQSPASSSGGGLAGLLAKLKGSSKPSTPVSTPKPSGGFLSKLF